MDDDVGRRLVMPAVGGGGNVGRRLVLPAVGDDVSRLRVAGSSGIFLCRVFRGCF